MAAERIKKAHLIANTKSGKGQGATLPELAKQVAAEHGFALAHYPTEDPSQFEKQMETAVKAAQGDGGLLIGAGGDGTIRAVAEKAAAGKVTFAAIPCGTFNFFARNHNVPEVPEEALKLAFTGEIRPVRLGWANGNYFLINASLGLYAQSIKEREVSTKRFGRQRIVVILSTMKTLLSRQKLINVTLVTSGQSINVKTPSIFIGNNALQLRDLQMDIAHCMKKDLLAVVILKPVSRLEMLRIFWRGLAKTLEKDDRLETFCVDSLTIHLPRKHITVALDGELFTMTSPIEVKALPRVLDMVLPPRVAA